MDGQEAKSGREFAVSLLDSQMVQMLSLIHISEPTRRS